MSPEVVIIVSIVDVADWCDLIRGVRPGDGHLYIRIVRQTRLNFNTELLVCNQEEYHMAQRACSGPASLLPADCPRESVSWFREQAQICISVTTSSTNRVNLIVNRSPHAARRTHVLGVQCKLGINPRERPDIVTREKSGVVVAVRRKVHNRGVLRADGGTQLLLNNILGELT